MKDHVDTYVHDRLLPRLRFLRVGAGPATKVAGDISARLKSILYRWADSDFRQTILLTAREEAAFYRPVAPDLDVAPLVVAGVRNSLLEDLGSTSVAARRLGVTEPPLGDDDIPAITGDAIVFWSKFEPARAVVAPPDAGLDPFAGLERRFPTAWRAISEAAQIAGVDRTYVPQGHNPRFAAARRRPDEVSSVTAVLSGMDGRIDAGLAGVLETVRQERLPAAFFPSFKGCTRNISKLLDVMERLFRAGAAFVTPNYYISDGYVARRDPLLRPIHRVADLPEQWRNLHGLSDRHRKLCEFVSAATAD